MSGSHLSGFDCSSSKLTTAFDSWAHGCPFFIFLSLRADNTSIVTVMLDPPGPPRAQVLRRLHGMPPVPPPIPGRRPPALPPKPFPSTSSSSNTTSVAPSKGIAIISRFPNSSNQVTSSVIMAIKKKRKLVSMFLLFVGRKTGNKSGWSGRRCGRSKEEGQESHCQ